MTATTAALPRSCPRCHGLLLHGRDIHGGYSSCMCCGFVQEWVSGPAIDLPGADPTRQRRREPMYRGRAL